MLSFIKHGFDAIPLSHGDEITYLNINVSKLFNLIQFACKLYFSSQNVKKYLTDLNFYDLSNFHFLAVMTI